MELNDTGSIERFRGSIPTNYFRNCHGVVLLYDLTDPTSLYDLEDWVTDAYTKTSGDDSICYMLIGNKLDLAVTQISDAGKNFSARHGIPEKLQFRISAISESKENLFRIFELLAREIYILQKSREPEEKASPDEGTIQLLDSTTENTPNSSRCSRC